MTEELWDPELNARLVEFRIAKRPPDLLAELSLAHLANLKGSASSDRAKALCRFLNDEFPRPKGTGKRSYQPQKLAPARDLGVAAFLSQLFVGCLREDGAGWIRLSLNKQNFKGKTVSWRTFDGLRHPWVVGGLLEEHTGYPGILAFGNPGPARGSMSRFRATPKLLKICKGHGITASNAGDHFHIEFEMPEELVRLTSPEVPTPNTSHVQRLRGEVAELNTFFSKHKLEGARHIGWVRMFHGGTDRDYKFDKGGRLYSQPSIPMLNYQQMPRDSRIAMKIDGEPLSEIDISASYMTIFYAAHGQSVDLARAYDDIIGADALHRAIVKFWINASFGHSGLIGAWSANLKKSFADKHRKEGWQIDPKKYPVARVRQLTLARHPLLSSVGKAAYGIPTTYGDLMFRESQAIVSTMARLAADHFIPSAPVHDSLLVPRSKVAIARRVLGEQFREVVGVTPALKTYPVAA